VSGIRSGVSYDDLSTLSGQLVEPKAAFAVPAEVWDSVRAWPVDHAVRDGQVHVVCGDCRQSVLAITGKDGTLYTYAELDQDGLLLAHLIQRHDWTREGPR